MRMKDNVAAPPQDAPTFMVLSNNRRHRTNLGAFVFGVPVACTNKLVGWYGQDEDGSGTSWPVFFIAGSQTPRLGWRWRCSRLQLTLGWRRRDLPLHVGGRLESERWVLWMLRHQWQRINKEEMERSSHRLWLNLLTHWLDLPLPGSPWSPLTLHPISHSAFLSRNCGPHPFGEGRGTGWRLRER